MAQPKNNKKREVENYTHADKERVNNPPVGLVTPETDKDAGKKTYAHDPHLDPQLVWAGKAEHTSFKVPTVSLHVHERVDPRTIVEAVRKRNGEKPQFSLFSAPEENPPIRQAIEFYKHRHNWTNRLIAGDSLLVMNSLVEKEGMAGKVQMVYVDPPYGIRYGSNFQPFVNKRDVKDGKDEDLTAEPEQIRAFRDTWELGVHSYLTHLRDRLLLARELLSESGSVFVQISDENLHHVRELLDEVFGEEHFFAVIPFKTKIPLRTSGLAGICDYLVWYAKDTSRIKFRKLYSEREAGTGSEFVFVEESSGGHRRLEKGEETKGLRLFRRLDLSSAGLTPSCVFPVRFNGATYKPTNGKSWKTNQEGMARLVAANRLIVLGNKLYYKLFFDDYPVVEMANIWADTAGGFTDTKRYVVETNPLIVQRCILMATDPGDLVFDPTCGAGTTAYVAEQWGRRWVTCDTSRVALTLARQRLMTAVFDYYELAQPGEGVGSGLKYKTVPHVTLGSIAQNPDISEGMTRDRIEAAIARTASYETLLDQPFEDRRKTRVSGPFTVEAVPAPAVKSVGELLEGVPRAADASVARFGETLRQGEWRDELLRTGIRGKAGQHIRFARLEPLPSCRYLHANGETRPNDAGADRVSERGVASEVQRTVVVAFGPEHAPLEQRQVALAIEDGQKLVPKPKIIVFAAFQFDPEASKDIDETHWPGVVLLKAQMNADLLTDDLKKKRASNESFWLIGQPDVQVERIPDGEDQGKFRVSVHGFDYYNTKTGNVESGGADKIAMCMLDPDYDGRSLFPRQVFFPMAGAKDGWAKLARNLKAEIDTDLIEAYRGTVSLPFEPGEHGRAAVKIVDDRGIESLKIVEIVR